MKPKKPIPERERIRRRIDADLIMAAFELDPYDLPKLTISPGLENKFHDSFSALVNKGCNPKDLECALRVGRQTEGKSRKPVPSLKRVKRLAKQLSQLANEIEDIEGSGFMRSMSIDETERLWFQTRPTNDDLLDLWSHQPHLNLERWLRKKAELYERWVKIASRKILPKTGTMLTRLGCLVPAIYVLETTGKLHAPQLLQLLDTIGGKTVDPTQLSRDLKTLRSDYPSLYFHVQLVLQVIKNANCCPECSLANLA